MLCHLECAPLIYALPLCLLTTHRKIIKLHLASSCQLIFYRPAFRRDLSHLCRSATGRFQLFNMAGVVMRWPCSSVASPILTSWASAPLPVNDLTCFGFYRNTLLWACNSVSCQRLQKDIGFLEARHIWPPSASTCSADKTPISSHVCFHSCIQFVCIPIDGNW